MWHKEYRDYPIDTPLIKHQVQPGHGIIGCEMHEINGWGSEHHIPLQTSHKGLIATLITRFFSLLEAPDSGSYLASLRSLSCLPQVRSHPGKPRRFPLCPGQISERAAMPALPPLFYVNQKNLSLVRPFNRPPATS